MAESEPIGSQRVMLDSAQHDYRDADLDPDLLSAPFNVRTNWFVITGSSCSGKTTLIDQLAGVGFHTIPEIGRWYFERELAKGRTMEEIRKDPAALTRQLHSMAIQRESRLATADPIFLDRGLPDTILYHRVAGIDPNTILLDCLQHRYALVFLLDRLPYQRDGIRVADDATAAYYDYWLARDYTALGYNIIRVPVRSPEERLALVLEQLVVQGI